MWPSYQPQTQSSTMEEFEFEDSVPEESSSVSMHSVATWLPEEDYFLAYCWCHYSKDSIRGNDQSMKTFWSKVQKSYNKKHPSRTRSLQVMSGRFGKISRQRTFYESQIFKVKQANPSGLGGEMDLHDRANAEFLRTRSLQVMSGRFGKISRQRTFYESQIFKVKQANPSGLGGDMDLHDRANAEFLKFFLHENKHSPHTYQFRGCYELLTTHPKWNSNNEKTIQGIQSKGKEKQKKSHKGGFTSSPGESDCSNFNDYVDGDDVEDYAEPSQKEPRPLGVKAAKKKNSIAAALDARLAASRERFAKENDDRRMNYKEKIAVMSRMADIKAEKLLVNKKQQEMEIMRMNTSYMDPDEAAYWNGLKKGNNDE